MKVLVVKTSSMGDVIHTLPALTDAAHAIAGIRFDWVVEEGFAEIPAWHPAVDRVIPVALRRWRRALWRTWRSGEWRRYRAMLQVESYDAVIDAQGLVKSAAAVTRLARGPRYGLDRASAREPLASRFYDHPLAVAKPQHAVERVRRLFAAALGYPVPASKGDACIKARFGGAVKPSYLVFLHGTTRREKHWPDVYWRELAALAAEAGWTVRLFWHGATERARADALAAATPAVIVQPPSTLTEIAGVLAGATAVVSVDTGLSHLTAALDVPNVTLFGPTDPGLVGSYGAHQISLRAADFPVASRLADPPDLASLTPAIVWARLTGLLNPGDNRAC